MTFPFLGACTTSWHCVTKKGKERMLRWTNDFILPKFISGLQCSERIYKRTASFSSIQKVRHVLCYRAGFQPPYENQTPFELIRDLRDLTYQLQIKGTLKPINLFKRSTEKHFT